MRALSSLVIALLLVANAFAAIEPTLCPSNNGQFLMSFAGIGTTPGYLADIMFYNTAPQDLEWGQPLGPYFDFQEGSSCYFSAMATTGPASLHCGLNLFSDSTRSIQVGTGSIDSNNQLTLVLGADGYTYVGGNATLNTVLTSGPADRLTNATLINYRSQSNVNIYFRPTRLYPTTTTEASVANNLQLSADQQSGYLTLWGSDGWNGTDYVGSVRHTGFDFRAALTCPPVTSAPTPAPTSSPTPPPTTGHSTGCPPTDPSAIFTIPSACIGSGQTIQHTTSASAISMSFTQSDSTSAFSGCNDS